MILKVIFALVLPCAGMAVVFVVYLCLIWLSMRRAEAVWAAQLDRPPKKGLSESELRRLPTGDCVLTSAECAVCLEEMERGQSVRLLPSCHHAFHLHCADTWLSKNPICPVCRASLRTPESVCPQPNPVSSSPDC